MGGLFSNYCNMATVGKSVQFRGIDNAVKAYENMEIPRWGLFQGSQFLMKYSGTNMKEGAELLDQYLNALDLRSADTNTYTLCIYDTAEKINSATKYDASFNFRLVDNIDSYQGNKVSGMLENRIAGIENKLNEVLQPDEEPEELTATQQLWATVSKILEHPQIQQVIASKLVGIIEGVSNTVGGLFAQPGYPAAIGAAPAAQKRDVQDENRKLQEAINILDPLDPLLGTHLLQLAQVAAADPGKYNSLIGMLKLL
jgi:hypothetical protein